MSKQSTPTPLEELIAESISWQRADDKFPRADAADLIHRLTIALDLAAGWKSPAEVAELVRANAEEAWGDGYEAGYDAGGESEWSRAGGPLGYGDNPHTKPAPNIAEESDE